MQTKPAPALDKTGIAQSQVGALLDTLRSLENSELGTITGWDATPRLENIRAAIDAAIECQEALALI